MSIELKEAAQQALLALENSQPHPSNPVIGLTNRDFIDHEETIRQLRTAIQQAEAQQPATAIACGIPGMAKTTCPYCEQGFAFEHEQPATGEPVKGPHCTTCGASMDEPHHPACGALTAVIIGVNTMAAQDDRQRRRFLAKKIHQTLRGAITHPAPSVPATPEPVDFPAGAIVNGRTLMERIEAYPFESQGGDLRMCSDWHELRRCFEHLADYVSPRPAPSVPNDHQIAALVNKVRDIARTFHDHQSLRERIAIELVPARKAKKEAP